MRKKNKEKNTRKKLQIIVDGKTYTYYVHRKSPYTAGFARAKPAKVTKDGKTKNTRRRKTQGAKMRDKINRNERKMKSKQLSLFD